MKRASFARRGAGYIARRLITLAGAALLFTTSACTDGATGWREADPVDAELLVSAHLIDLEIRTLVVTVTAPDITSPLVFNLEADENGNASGTVKVPTGSSRLFTVEAFDLVGAVTHEGSAEVDVARGQNPPVKIKLKPKAGHVPIDVTVADYVVEVHPSGIDVGSGETYPMSAVVMDASGQPLEVAVQWATLNPAIVTVDQTGLITGGVTGTTLVVATYAGVGGAAQVSVNGGGATITWYPDDDGDGFGRHPGQDFPVGLEPPDWVLNADDCDDTDASISPAAPEVQGDGIDNNCDGRIDEDDPPFGGPVLSEIDYDNPGEDLAEFVEVYNGSPVPIDLSTVVVVFFDGATEQAYDEVPLTGTLLPGETLPIGLTANALQNGPADAVALYQGFPGEFPIPVRDARLLDALVYEDDGSAPLLSALMDDPGWIEDAGIEDVSLQRCGVPPLSVSAWVEEGPPSPGTDATCSAGSTDSDGDGLSDAREVKELGSDPLDPDTDQDGVPDGTEVELYEFVGGSVFWQVWLDADWDDDGLSDYDEAYDEAGNPILPPPGRLPDGAVWDRDGDGLSDGQELGVTDPIPGGVSQGSGIPFTGSDPAVFVPDADPTTTTNPYSFDTDLDGIADGAEDFNLDGAWDGRLNTPGAGYETNPNVADSDKDGATDLQEGGPGPKAPDTDGDGVIAALDSDETLVVNQPPEVEGLMLEPWPVGPGTNVPLSCMVTSWDPDEGPAPLTHDFTWYLNGAVVFADPGRGEPFSEYIFESLVGGDEVGCSVNAFDGADRSAEIGAFAIVEAVNQAPRAGTVSLTPDPAFPDSPVTCTAEGFIDPDGGPEPLSYTFTWHVFDAAGPLKYERVDAPSPLGVISELGSVGLEVGDLVNCGVFASDGLADSPGVGGNVTVSDPAPTDSDADGLSDAAEEAAGTDPLDPDTDNDGLADVEELQAWWGFATDPLDADTDDDGIPDGGEGHRDPDTGEWTAIADPLDPDTDDDGLSDGLEAAAAEPWPAGVSDGVMLPYRGTDGPFVGDQDPSTWTDLLNPDTDGDGLWDGVEDANADGQFDPGAGETDPLDPDTDDDGLNDGTELMFATDPLNPDTDSDKLTDGEEFFTYGTDPLKADTDSDSLSDGEEVLLHGTDPLNPDTDGDGPSDGTEVNHTGTDPLNPDSDGDGVGDGEELTLGTDPLDPDTDDDGLTDGEELHDYDTNPLLADTDGDGLSDGNEINLYGTNPRNADTDGDGLSDGEEVNKYGTDPLDVDTDKDGIWDGVEISQGTDPLDPNSVIN